jgi:hypothetical protein
MTSGSINNNRHILLCSLSTTLGGVELRMGLEARLLQQAGYKVVVGINMYPVLKEWVCALEAHNVRVIDYDPPPFMEKWWWWRKSKLSKFGLLEKKQDLLWCVAWRRNKLLAKKTHENFL